ncbi:exophilin-5-like [Arapaima gigas]
MATRVTLSSSRWDINVLLYEEEEAAVRRVLERDSNLRQVDRHRVQRLREVSADGRWFRGVSGQWFHEIQRVNQGYGSASGSSHTSSSASEVKRKGQRITLNDKGEEHRKPAGTRLRTRLTSLLSFRFPQKTKHSKRR